MWKEDPQMGAGERERGERDGEEGAGMIMRVKCILSRCPDQTDGQPGWRSEVDGQGSRCGGHMLV